MRRYLLLGFALLALVALTAPSAALAQTAPGGDEPPIDGNKGQATSSAAQAAAQGAKASGGHVGAAVSGAVRSDNSQGQGPKR